MNEVLIKRTSLHRYSFAQSTARGKRACATALTFTNPNPYDLYRKKEMFSKRDFSFPVGLLRDVITHCQDNEISYDIDDLTFIPPVSSAIDKRLTGKYEHQVEAVRAFFSKRIGIIKVPTRGGKTFIASEIVRQWLVTASKTQNFLFVVDTEDLFRQAVGDIQQFFKLYKKLQIGEIRAGTFAPKQITVAMIQTVHRMVNDSHLPRRKQINNFLKTVDFLTVDEIHDNASADRLKIYQRCTNLRYQLCLSATPYRENAWFANLKLRAWSGDIVYEVAQDALISRGVLTAYKVMELVVDHRQFSYVLENDDYRGIEKAVIHKSDFRNRILLCLTTLLERRGLKTLFLFQSIEHGQWFSAQTGIPFIHGGTSVDERQLQKQLFLQTSELFLAASGIFKKGITLPEARVMVNCDGGLEPANLVQKAGRVLGATAEKNRSAVIDFVDIYDRYFSEHSDVRLQTYVDAVGEQGVQFVDTVEQDWTNKVDQWLSSWFAAKDSGVTQ